MALSPSVSRPFWRIFVRLPFPDALRNRAFRDLWLGQAISQLGDALYYVGFMFMVKKITGSDAMVGVVGALETIPYLLFGPYAGVQADRLDRKRIMMTSDLVCGAFLLLFGLSILVFGRPLLPILLAAPFMISTARVFFMPAKSAAIPALVPPAGLMKANALSMTTQSFMPLLGLAFSAAVLSQLYSLSASGFYFSVVGLNAISFLGSAFYIARLPKVMPDRTDVHETHVLSDLKEGIRYLKTRHDLNVLTALLAVFRLSTAPFFVVYLAANDKYLGGRPSTVMWMEGSFFLGMVVSGAFLGSLRPRYPTRWFSFGLGAVGATVGAMAFFPNFTAYMVLNLIAGLAVPLADIPIIAYLQTSVPDAYRGRVNAVRDMVATGVMPIGMIGGGLLVSKVGIFGGWLGMGTGMVVACSVGMLDRRYRNVVMPEIEAASSTVGSEDALATV